MAGPVVLGVMDFIAASSTPDYSLVRDSISSLALTPIGWIQTIGFLAIGILVEIFVAGLLYNIDGVRGFHLGIAILVFVGFGMLMVGAFHTDPQGAADTLEGTIHSYSAYAVFWLFPVSILLLAPSLKHDPDWHSLYKYTVVAGIIAILFAAVIGFLDDDFAWFGLYERLLVANMIIWVEVAAIRLLCLSVKRRAKAEDVAVSSSLLI